MHRTNRVPRVPLGALLMLSLLLGGGGARAWAQEAKKDDGKGRHVIDMVVNGTAFLQTKAYTDKDGKQVHPKIGTVVNDRENVVRVSPTLSDPSTVLLTGLSPGSVTLTVTPAPEPGAVNPLEAESVLVNVILDVTQLKKILKDTVPTAAVTPIPGAGNTIILSGTVAHSEDVDTLLRVAASVNVGVGPPNIINAMRVGGVMQVQLDVVVALVARDEIRRMSVDIWDQGQQHTFTTVPGGSISLPSPGSGITGQIPPVTQPFTIENIVSSPNNTPFNTFLSVFNSRQAVFAFLQALRTNDLAKVLAEPHLVTMSGKPANFVSGGEQAVPNVTGFGGVAGVQFVPFGTRLQFLPVVMGNGKIYIEVEPEVSRLDAASGVQLAGSSLIPGRATQRVRTAVMLEDGQTFAVGGLIQNEVTAGITKVPVIGDMPFIGPLFSSKSYRELETELVILVTPHLVDPMDCCQVPHYLPGQETRRPDDFELYLENILEAPRGSREVNHGTRYVPAWKNSPTAKCYPCVSAGTGPNVCPNCTGGTGVPIPHDYLQQPGPVAPPTGANVMVEQGPAPMPAQVQQTGGSVEQASPLPAGEVAPQAPVDMGSPANLPPVSSVPLGSTGPN